MQTKHIYKADINTGGVVMENNNTPKTTFNLLMTKEIEQNLMIASCKQLMDQNLISKEIFQAVKTKILKS
jgi:hypothetical protein